ncbi:atherin-like [Gracilinanus agilis]|uniref:atherin-like n=1 Tax=Gracilinanus agilis TaxID=191870 RepID=UPI001CFF0C80|nr:atherin-like [Gracilinanus agilis]
MTRERKVCRAELTSETHPSLSTLGQGQGKGQGRGLPGSRAWRPGLPEGWGKGRVLSSREGGAPPPSPSGPFAPLARGNGQRLPGAGGQRGPSGLAPAPRRIPPTPAALSPGIPTEARPLAAAAAAAASSPAPASAAAASRAVYTVGPFTPPPPLPPSLHLSAVAATAAAAAAAAAASSVAASSLWGIFQPPTPRKQRLQPRRQETPPQLPRGDETVKTRAASPPLSSSSSSSNSAPSAMGPLLLP